MTPSKIPAITIVVPVYNAINELPNSIRSIINQSRDFDDLKVIFIDDCSTDGSSEL